jgi:hypothetical protein
VTGNPLPIAGTKLAGTKLMDIIIYVSGDEALRAAQTVVDKVGPVNGRTIGVIDLFGATLNGVPAVVLHVMRLKRKGTMPLTLADGYPVLSGELPSPSQLRHLLEERSTEPAALVTRSESAVDFPTASRVYMSIFVKDLKESVRFYEVFLASCRPNCAMTMQSLK